MGQDGPVARRWNDAGTGAVDCCGLPRRDKLRRKWDETIRHGDREAYVQRGLQIYDRSLRRKLLWGVYVVPVVTIVVVIYLVNFA